MNLSYRGVEGVIREEEQGTTEHNASIVPRLQGRNEDSLTTHSMGVLFHLIKKN